MRRGVRLIAASCAAGAALSCVGGAAAGLLTGVLDPEQSATGNGSLMVDASVAYAAVHHGAGGGIVRLYLYWNRVADKGAPVSPADPDDPSYDWDVVDAQVEAADAAGLKVMLDFRSAPLWAQDPAGANLDGTYKPNAAMLADFATAAAKRYNGDFPNPGNPLPRVGFWEVWNEPNLAHFLKPQSTAPKMYRKLLNQAAHALHAVNPANVVVAGGTAPFGNAENHTPMAFLRELLCLSKPPYHSVCNLNVEADVFTHHPYTQGSPQHHAVSSDNISLGDLPEWAALIRAARKTGHIRTFADTKKTTVGLWATELGWDTNPPDPKGVPTALHARWTSEALYRVWKSGLTAAIWTQMRDYPMNAPCPWRPYQAGLYEASSSATDLPPKLSLTAFRFPFVIYAGGGKLTVWGRTPTGLPGSVRIQRLTSSGWIQVKRLAASSQGIFAKSWSSTKKTGYYRAVADDASVASVKFSLVRPADRTVSVFGTPGVCS